MKKKELQDLLTKTEAELEKLAVYDRHQIENLTAQRDDGLERVKVKEKDEEGAKEKHGREKAELEKQYTEYIEEISLKFEEEKQRLNDVINNLNISIGTLSRDLQEANKLIDALGGTKEGQRLYKEKLRKEAEDRIKAARKVIEDLDKSE